MLIISEGCWRGIARVSAWRRRLQYSEHGKVTWLIRRDNRNLSVSRKSAGIRQICWYDNDIPLMTRKSVKFYLNSVGDLVKCPNRHLIYYYRKISTRIFDDPANIHFFSLIKLFCNLVKYITWNIIICILTNSQTSDLNLCISTLILGLYTSFK